MIEPAGPRDLPVVLDLLEKAGLPTEGVAESFGSFLVWRDDEAGAIGAVGLEIYDRVGLLRSLVVGSRHRARGIGHRLCAELERRAPELGLRDLYLLTVDAEEFFAGRGYREIERDAAPQSMATCDELTRLCPASATLMQKSLRS